MPAALALSPHLDDAAFSCGGALATLAEAGWRVVVATVFTRSVPEPSGFALACQLDKGLGPEIDYMALRRSEDQKAARELGAEVVWLPFPEAPHRGYSSAAALFGALRPDDTISDALPVAIAEAVDVVAPNLVLGPQAIGGHVDHVELVRAINRCALGCPLLWWQDFPYIARETSSKQPFHRHMEELGSLEIRLTSGAQRRKRDACLSYASQLSFQFGGPAGLDRALHDSGGFEHFRSQNCPVEYLDILRHPWTSAPASSA